MRLSIATARQQLVFHAVMGLLLMLCQPFQQLYSGNQNVYFLWGMAKAGIGSLALDPLLAETDPYPLFSLLVMLIAGHGHPWHFHLAYWAMCAVCSFALFGIAHHLFDLYGRPLKLAVFSAMFLLMNSGGIWSGLLRELVGIDLLGVWDSGIAGQSVLQGYLQPSTAGVFLLLSVHHFLRKQPAGVFLSLAAAAIIHANYMFLGAGMGLVYLLLFVSRRRVRMSDYIAWAGFSVLIVMPQLLYVATFFLPHTDEEAAVLTEAVTRTAAGNIHLDPSLWLDLPTAIQCFALLAVISLWFRTPLGNLLLSFTIFFGLIGGLAFALGSQTLLSLTPWRVSVVLIPVSVIALAGRILHPDHDPQSNGRTYGLLLAGCVLLFSFAWFRVFGYDDIRFLSEWRWKTIIGLIAAVAIGFLPWKKMRHGFPITALAAITILGAVATGVLGHVMERRFRGDRPERGITEFLRQNARQDELVLMPTHLASLRMNASVAVVADDHLVHGLQLPRLLDRQQLVRAFYSEGFTDGAWPLLNRDLAITSVIIPMEMKIPTDLPWGEVYRDEHYVILRMTEK
jgi:hypothetical protein